MTWDIGWKRRTRATPGRGFLHWGHGSGRGRRGGRYRSTAGEPSVAPAGDATPHRPCVRPDDARRDRRAAGRRDQRRGGRRLSRVLQRLRLRRAVRRHARRWPRRRRAHSAGSDGGLRRTRGRGHAGKCLRRPAATGRARPAERCPHGLRDGAGWRDPRDRRLHGRIVPGHHDLRRRAERDGRRGPHLAVREEPARGRRPDRAGVDELRRQRVRDRQAPGLTRRRRRRPLRPRADAGVLPRRLFGDRRLAAGLHPGHRRTLGQPAHHGAGRRCRRSPPSSSSRS